MTSVANIVDSAIAENTVTIFSKSWCPYCKRAKALFKTEFPDAVIKIYELDEMDEGDDIQNYLAKKTRQRSVPNIFINQQHIGGCDTVVSLNSQDKLADLVNA